MGAGAPHISLLSARLSVKLASSFAHAFDVSSWETEWSASVRVFKGAVERSRRSHGSHD